MVQIGSCQRTVPPLRVVNERDIEGLVDVSVRIIHPEERVCAPGPKLLPSKSFPPATPASYVYPPLRIIEARNVIARPESDLPIIGDSVVFPDNMDFERHVSYEIFHGHLRLSVNRSHAKFVGRLPERARNRRRGIILTSWKYGNWAHFVTEVLPKLLVANSSPEISSLPLIIGNKGLHQTRALLELFNHPKREIIEISVPQYLDDAIYISSVATPPYDLHYPLEGIPSIPPDDCMYSPWALQLVQHHAQDRMKIAPVPRALEKAKRLYLRRRGGPRNLMNSAEVESFFERAGWSVVDPVDLKPAEQISLFSRAECIVGPIGAGLTNMIFSPPGCRVAAIYMANTHASYYYFSNMAHALGHHFGYIIGRVSPHHFEHPVHRHYSINLADLSAAYDEFF